MDSKLNGRIRCCREFSKLDATQLKALKDFLPTADERQGITAYMQQAGASEEAKAKAFKTLSECEKYMYSMMDVTEAEEKFQCLLFRSNFGPRFDELVESIRVVEKACDEVRGSERLREVMGMILILVNQINTGGDGSGAAGFSLDALLKLNEVRRVVYCCDESEPW